MASKDPVAAHEQDRAKQENKDSQRKQALEQKAAKANPAGGEVELSVKTVPSEPNPGTAEEQAADKRQRPITAETDPEFRRN